jgi:hypothetical protein
MRFTEYVNIRIAGGKSTNLADFADISACLESRSSSAGVLAGVEGSCAPKVSRTQRRWEAEQKFARSRKLVNRLTVIPLTKGITMPEQMRPASKKDAPDPAVHFDRSDPRHESGQGRMDNNTKATPTPSADVMPDTVTHAQATDKQLNAEEAATIAPPTEDARAKKESTGWKKRKS